MNKLLYLAILFCLVFFSSCDNNKEEKTFSYSLAVEETGGAMGLENDEIENLYHLITNRIETLNSNFGEYQNFSKTSSDPDKDAMSIYNSQSKLVEKELGQLVTEFNEIRKSYAQQILIMPGNVYIDTKVYLVLLKNNNGKEEVIKQGESFHFEAEGGKDYSK